ncbi:MAG TPA: LUD domain-containing protein [Desulfitobacterium dehalogenans]|uniref:LUD domain-containing protein n=1 Tax=Desulfitobacterium dehalogenans TaxID=36854 RepID=A0A7C6Z7C2_9FIRM|nr:LUD domain-containing protein [Desulfitobacterium dehalogenans]
MGDMNFLYERFQTKLQAVSGECYRAKTLKDAEELIAQIVKEKEIESVAMINSPIAKAMSLPEKLSDRGITVYTERYPEVTPTVGAGITEMKWAIAELGTLVQYAEDVNERLCSSFTPIHIALVQTSTLLPDIMTALATVHKEPRIPGFVGFITGPSRTSDIERVLTIGVHGPEQLIAIFIDEEAGEGVSNG